MYPLDTELLNRFSFDVHARKAWLQGLSPKENRTIPAINYEFVHRISTLYPNVRLSINGDIKSILEIMNSLRTFSGSVMIGRAIYSNPMLLYELSLELDESSTFLTYGDKLKLINENRIRVINEYLSYIDATNLFLMKNGSLPHGANFNTYLLPLMEMYSGTPVSGFFKDQLHKAINPNRNNILALNQSKGANGLSPELSFSSQVELALLRTQSQLKKFKLKIPL